MLVLNRRVSESIMINDDITITILEINGKQVRLGITAPIATVVHRKEIYLKIQQEKKQED